MLFNNFKPCPWLINKQIKNLSPEVWRHFLCRFLFFFLKSTLNWESKPKSYWSELLNSSEDIKELKVGIHGISFSQLSNIQNRSLVASIWSPDLLIWMCACVPGCVCAHGCLLASVWNRWPSLADELVLVYTAYSFFSMTAVSNINRVSQLIFIRIEQCKQ